MRGYNQLTLDQRYQIQECASWKRKLKLETIAVRTGISKSTISREIKRNKSLRGYRALHAHCKALEALSKHSGTRQAQVYTLSLHSLLLETMAE